MSYRYSTNSSDNRSALSTPKGPSLYTAPRVWTVSIDTLMQRLAPRAYTQAHSLFLNAGDALDPARRTGQHARFKADLLTLCLRRSSIMAVEGQAIANHERRQTD